MYVRHRCGSSRSNALLKSRGDSQSSNRCILVDLYKSLWWPKTQRRIAAPVSALPAPASPPTSRCARSSAPEHYELKSAITGTSRWLAATLRTPSEAVTSGKFFALIIGRPIRRATSTLPD